MEVTEDLGGIGEFVIVAGGEAKVLARCGDGGVGEGGEEEYGKNPGHR